jgi:hypothetical protein
MSDEMDRPIKKLFNLDLGCAIGGLLYKYWAAWGTMNGNYKKDGNYGKYNSHNSHPSYNSHSCSLLSGEED